MTTKFNMMQLYRYVVHNISSYEAVLVQEKWKLGNGYYEYE